MPLLGEVALRAVGLAQEHVRIVLCASKVTGTCSDTSLPAAGADAAADDTLLWKYGEKAATSCVLGHPFMH